MIWKYLDGDTSRSNKALLLLFVLCGAWSIVTANKWPVIHISGFRVVSCLAKFRKGKGELRFRGFWDLLGTSTSDGLRGKSCPNTLSVIFRLLSQFQYLCICVCMRAHAQKHTLQPFRLILNCLPAEIWAWLHSADTIQLTDSTWEVCFWNSCLFWNWTKMHTLKQTTYPSLYYTYTHINSLPVTSVCFKFSAYCPECQVLVWMSVCDSKRTSGMDSLPFQKQTGGFTEEWGVPWFYIGLIGYDRSIPGPFLDTNPFVDDQHSIYYCLSDCQWISLFKQAFLKHLFTHRALKI